MGILGFKEFLEEKNEEKDFVWLEKVYLKDTFVIIDGNEILHGLWSKCNSAGRFKFQAHRKFYKERQGDAIQQMQTAVNKRKRSDKPYLCHLVFRQALEEMNVIRATARNDTDVDAAALSNLLDAPILASDTNFCTYDLKAGFLPINQFCWENVFDNNSIKAYRYKIDNLVRHCKISREHMSLLAALFDNHDPKRFQAFREQTFGRGRWNDQLKRCLKWLSKGTLQQKIEKIYSSAHDREKIQKEIELHLKPSIKASLLDELAKKIPDQQDRLMSAQNILEEDASQDDFFNILISKVYAGEFPYWAIAIIRKLNIGEEIVRSLPVVFTEPSKFESPHETAKPIQKASYQLLLHMSGIGNNTMTVQELDRVGMKYLPTEPVLIEQNFNLAGLMLTNGINRETFEKRKNYLLGILVEDKEKKIYTENLKNNISDNMKLCLSATIFWKATAKPHENVSKALALVFTLLQCSYNNQKEKVNAYLQEILTTVRLSLEQYLDLVQCFAQWQVCIHEAIYLNQILEFPLPEPMISRWFDEDVAERVYNAFHQDTNVEEGLNNIPGAQELYIRLCEVLLQ